MRRVPFVRAENFTVSVHRKMERDALRIDATRQLRIAITSAATRSPARRRRSNYLAYPSVAQPSRDEREYSWAESPFVCV